MLHKLATRRYALDRSVEKRAQQNVELGFFARILFTARSAIDFQRQSPELGKHKLFTAEQGEIGPSHPARHPIRQLVSPPYPFPRHCYEGRRRIYLVSDLYPYTRGWVPGYPADSPKIFFPPRGCLRGSYLELPSTISVHSFTIHCSM